jgi:hypothetical protein
MLLTSALLSAVLLGFATAARSQLVILTPTGETRDGLPVLRVHPDAAATAAILTRGFSGRLLRLYALEQEFLRQRIGRAPEAAYLLLSNRQGGFPQVGFYLGDERKSDAGWVDLHRTSSASGRFGAMDQIFPHELLHVIVRQLAGEPRRSGGNQMHAVGVRSDAVTAFSEGLAEHVQILAVDDPDAVAGTIALRTDEAARARADRAIDDYARDLTRTWWPVQPARLRFLLWFSQTEQVQRYHAVKANLFARQAVLPADLLARSDRYPAYLFQSVVAGAPDGVAKPAGVMLATDGAVAHLFWRLMTDASVQQRYRDDGFYAAFGITRAEVTPLENVYLKLFAVLADGRPATTVELLHAWARLFPEDAADLDRGVRDALLGQSLPAAPELWLANATLLTGTSLFDQYRALPRVHTFDANAATAFDWLSVPAVTPAQAAQLVGDAPYQSLDALTRSAALTAPLRARVSEMSAAMAQLREAAAGAEETLSVWTIARPYLWRLSVIMLAATAAGAWLARRAGVRRGWAAALLAFTATLLVVAFAWIVTSPRWFPVAAPIVAGGVPWALWRLMRRRTAGSIARALGIWAAAALPALALVYRW